MSTVFEKVKKQRKTTELLLNELESLYFLLKIAPDKQLVLQKIKEREKILSKRDVNFKQYLKEKNND